MPEQWLPWEKMQRTDEAITDSLAHWTCLSVRGVQILTADVNKSGCVFVYSCVLFRVRLSTYWWTLGSLEAIRA